jgi:hypothetical protein
MEFISKGVFLLSTLALNIHDKILHNAMLDSGASHNLMPKAIMERLNLDITRPYKDLFSFDSSQVKCLGLIKDLCVTLVQCPAKSIVMDIVVADIPPKYGMLLSRSWGEKLQGSLQVRYVICHHICFWSTKKLYRETLMKYMVSSAEKPQNFPYTPCILIWTLLSCTIQTMTKRKSQPKEEIQNN